MDKTDREEMNKYIKELNTYIILALFFIIYFIIETIFIVFEIFKEECLNMFIYFKLE